MMVAVYWPDLNEPIKVAPPQRFVEPTPVKLVESAAERGIIFEHRKRSHHLESIADSYGNGVCILDFDQDGFEDIFLPAGQGTTRRYGRQHWWNANQASVLYHNREGRYFEPYDAIPTRDLAGYGCTAGDLNGDQLPDIVVGDIGKLHLLLNVREGRWHRHTIALPQADHWPTGMLIRDTNQDGLMDIVVATLVSYRNDLKVGNEEYAYHGPVSFDTSQYNGQTNLILLGNSQGSTPDFEIRELPGQQRTLSVMTTDDPSSFVMVNANGANTVIQRLDGSQQDPGRFTFPASQISTIEVDRKPRFLVANHGTTGYPID